MNTDQLELPELSAARLDAIERELFTRIRHDAAQQGTARRTRRRRAWLGAGAAAAIIVVAAVIGPALSGGLGLGGSSTGAADSAAEPAVGQEMSGPADGDLSTGDEGASVYEGSAGGAEAPAEEESAGREVIATASVTLETTDAAAASDRITALATDAGGYVESLSLQRAEGIADESAGDMAMEPYGGDAWITVRVPAAQLTEVTTALASIGEVRSSEIHRADVTTEVVDLRARVAALEASVDRLRELMADAASTADLLTAEDALAERQAELDSLRGQLAVLDDQVALSSLTVWLTEPAPVVAADPTGFGDGLGAGWNTLVATVNGIVIGLGFLLPWLVAIGIAVVLVTVIVRAVRRRRSHVDSASAEVE
ncbi:DUF4349 domain-containing protein [Microbacterium dauci]|uniref:DUF4349 domain-containing protein n=1 Tax=Microbacterium dauci TaxID=3048008 RepID=A0ABT6ZBR5_9MICO|nr:DUF4349 domain-containing protein [Microbacterium sp. LX3-4]MDJ1113601.1 DUF4349 domain-containing protein [Microbacterium sp. LX3-4]